MLLVQPTEKNVEDAKQINSWEDTSFLQTPTLAPSLRRLGIPEMDLVHRLPNMHSGTKLLPQ